MTCEEQVQQSLSLSLSLSLIYGSTQVLFVILLSQQQIGQ